ncbi:MAG: D-3-phosphoglycerate dehydrogenase [Lysobacterales bacterium]|jgi:D-3-phosphoglycerate dehydrogenase
MKILISDKLAKEGIDILEANEGFQVDCKFGISAKDLKDVIKDYDGLIIRSGTTVTDDILERADNLKVIGRAGVGLDNVDLEAATKKGVLAMNTPAGNTTSTAEQTFSLILSLARNTPQACASVKAGKWERAKFSGIELRGKTLGVVGFGRIGSTVAKFAQAFGMDIVVFDPFLTEERAVKANVSVGTLEEVLKKSDYVTLHIPKTKETANLISAKEFDMMKNTARLVNCARGGIIDEKALVIALKEGKIAGCALDVYEVEPPDFSSELFSLDNCITTPHLGASTSEAQVNVAVEIAESVRDALLGKGIANAANFPSMDAETHKVLKPYCDLAFKMGKFSGQLINSGIKDIKITYNGVITDYKSAGVTLSLINGLLTPILGSDVNGINALAAAKERDIHIEEINSHKETEYVNSIEVEIVTEKEPFCILGTLSSNKEARIVRINNVNLECTPKGSMLYINNNDKPGLVGVIGTVLADANINIAAISLGRGSQDGVATSVVSTDSEISDAVVEELRSKDGVLKIHALEV